MHQQSQPGHEKKPLLVAANGDPLYVQAAALLRERILNGVLAPGQRLDSEQDIAHEFAVSRITVRKAMDVLRGEGLVITHQGLGTFVRGQRVHQVLARLETFDQVLAGQGLAPDTLLLDFDLTAPSAAAARAFGSQPNGCVLFVRRLHRVEGAPIAVVDTSLPARIGQQFKRRAVEDHPFYELLPKVSVQIGAAQQWIRAESASLKLSKLLEVKEGAPVLVCERVTFDADEHPIVHCIFYYRADRFEFRVLLADRESRNPWMPAGLARLEEAD